VPKQGRGTSSGAAGERVGVPLPDLTGVHLHELPAMDDPALLDAVAEVLRRPEEFTEKWCGSDTETGGNRQRHPVPAGQIPGRTAL
jgi:hypothetical protein